MEWNALTTVHAASQVRGREIYRFLRDGCGARFMQFIPIVERATPESLRWPNGVGGAVRDRPLYVQDGDLVTQRSVSPVGYGRFLIDVFEDWVRRDVGEVYVQMFDVALANWYGEPSGLCVHSETCGLALALEHNGDLYSCDHFVEPAHKLGNIREDKMIDLIVLPQQRVRSGETRLAPAILPGVRRAVRLPRRLPEGSLRLYARGRAGVALPLSQLQGLLPPRRPAMRAMCELLRRSRALRGGRRLRRTGREARQERPLHVRIGPHVEGLPRRPGPGDRLGRPYLALPAGPASSAWLCLGNDGLDDLVGEPPQRAAGKDRGENDMRNAGVDHFQNQGTGGRRAGGSSQRTIVCMERTMSWLSRPMAAQCSSRAWLFCRYSADGGPG